MGWLQNVQARRHERQQFRRAAVAASPRPLSADELLGWAREWAPDTRITDDGRLMLTRTIEVVGPLDVDEEMRKREKVPPGMVTVYRVHDDDGPSTDDDGPSTYDDVYCPDGRDFAIGLAHRVGGWVRYPPGRSREFHRPEDSGWFRRVFAPKRLTAAEVAEALAPHLPHLVAVEGHGDLLFRLDSGPIAVHASPLDEYDTTYPSVDLQPWFTSWEQTTEYVIEGETEVDATSVQAAAEALRDATGGLLLDGSGFLMY